MGITIGQVVVYRNQMDAFTTEGIEIGGQCRHQRFALTGAHFRNLALVQGHATDKLYIKMTQAKHSLARLADHGKRLRQNVVETLTLCQTGLELIGFSRQLLIVERLHVVRQRVDLFDHFTHALQLATVARAENVLQCFT